MSKGLRIGLIVVGGVLAAALLIGVGVGLAGIVWGVNAGTPVWTQGGAAAWSPMGMWSGGRQAPGGGWGMMSGGWTEGNGWGMMSGGGMMGGSSSLSGVEPLSLEAAEKAVGEYVASLGNADLRVGEVMIFSNHAYAEIVEASTGVGAMEVLVDPVTLNVYPEHGPNMMWNAKYSPMGGAGYGMMGMMGGAWGWPTSGTIDPSSMPVSAAEAVTAAQAYLNQALPGTVADAHADPFYGYYTLHILRDGNVVGMLSVHGTTGQVFLHTWHGDFIEMAELES